MVGQDGTSKTPEKVKGRRGLAGLRYGKYLSTSPHNIARPCCIL
ncbi:hypothetical protein BOO71_0008131 [Deinococcus marmoris]|uniref:Uncharacterized protein n=1 Tax=Deinococcus marmoris TaxID=249408 RepID=A0A1U7NXW1_9DEIO|nr:hypothetical protein BOO71_0008131 [Deinococcus marmoris]